jgi:spore germination protein GerM
MARLALEELLKGPTPDEQKEGYYTSINSGVEIENFRIENGSAWVDFNDRFDESVAGSCQVEAIRAQVEKTLLQFPSIREVQITVQGRLSTAFQP